MKEYLPHVLELFSHDERFLLKDSNLKAHALTKIVLNFFSVIPNCKALFGLKFLQYIKQYKLPFKNYISNISIEDFSKKLLHKSYIDTGPNKIYLNSFYLSYSRLYDGLDKLMLLDLLSYEQPSELQGMTSAKKELNEYCNMKEKRLLWSCVSPHDLSVVLESATAFLLGRKRNISCLLYTSRCV